MSLPKHISYSELSDWSRCTHLHKKAWIERVTEFEGNEFTAFGRAIHEACEKSLIDDSVNDEEIFQIGFSRELKQLMEANVEVDSKLIKEMRKSATEILPELRPALTDYFGDYEVFKTEDTLYEPINDTDINFKGFIDAIIKVGDIYHVVDWKTAGWGWKPEKKADKMIGYQLTLYKHFFCQKYGISPENVETHFALLKRTAKKDRVEIFRITSGPKKTENALKLLNQALYNITKRISVKNRLSCTKPYRCKLYGTEHCTR